MNAKRKSTAAGPAVPSQTMPGLEAAALLSQPIPSEPATAQTADIPAGRGIRAESVVDMAAIAQRGAAHAEAVEAAALKGAEETPAAFDAALAERETLQAERAGEARLAAGIREHFAARLDRTKAVVLKVIVIYALLAVGEVLLNTSAGVAQGEVMWLAAISFIGLAAGAVAIGWVVGTQLSDAADRISAGPIPESAEGRGLDALFLPKGRGPLSAVTPDLVIWMSFLVGLAVANSLLVSQMRAEAGMSTAWGPVAGLLVLVAAAPPYLLRNKAADMLTECERRAGIATAGIKAESAIIDRHTAAQRITRAALDTVVDKANAQYFAALAGGYGQIATRQQHIGGHTFDLESSPVRVDQMRVAPGAAAEIDPDRAPTTDYERSRAVSEPAAKAAPDAPSTPVAFRRFEDSLDEFWAAPFGLEPVRSLNGHGSISGQA